MICSENSENMGHSKSRIRLKNNLCSEKRACSENTICSESTIYSESTMCPKNMNKGILLIILLLCLSCLVAGGRSTWAFAPVPQRDEQEMNLPEYKGYVNDFAEVLSPQEEETITNLTRELQQKTTAEVAVVTLESVAPYEINLYAVKLFEKWGIGVKGKDNGVLILMALKEHEVRIEVGYGLEGILPDGLTGEIIRKYMVPAFKKGKYGNGIVSGTMAVILQVSKEYHVEITGLPKIPEAGEQQEPESDLHSMMEFIFTLLFLILLLGWKTGLLTYFIFGPRGGGYWGGRGGGGFGGGGFGGGGGGFGGFGGFGGGSSGGGGATGRW
jgi:uncharacterized protein